jgi:hypothetical protein
MTLDEIGLKHHTDKASSNHCYLSIYEKYLSQWKDKAFTLLEIGVASGASIKVWQEYFPNAKIYGIDINPDCKAENVFIGSQTDEKFLDEILYEIGTPDIIIDDGSHVGSDMIFTFKKLFPKVNPGGFYVVEDTHCFYCQTYGSAPPYGQGMSEVFNFFSMLTSHVDVHGRAMTGNAQNAIDSGIQIPPVPEFSRILNAMHIHPSLWWFEKK